MNNRKTPLKSIRKYCIECSGESKREVRACTVSGCALHFYRFGKNPNRTVTGSSVSKTKTGVKT